MTSVLAAIALLGICGYVAVEDRLEKKTKAPPEKVYTRTDLSNWLSGADGTKSDDVLKTPEKTTLDVEAKLGKPDHRSVTEGPRLLKEGYIYSGITIDPATGKIDTTTEIEFDPHSLRFIGIKFVP